MPDYADIYQNQSAKYEEFVSHEDYQHNLLPALISITEFKNKVVAEFGAGTGRLTRMLLPLVKSITAFEGSAGMISIAQDKLRETGFTNWETVMADNRKVSFPSNAADIAISGWSICCVPSFAGSAWKEELIKAIKEMERVVKSGGSIIIIETLGTGNREPKAPGKMAAYYEEFAKWGYQYNTLRTDYQFDSRTQAEELTEFFFGKDMVKYLEEQNSETILPECTGIWWKIKR